MNAVGLGAWNSPPSLQRRILSVWLPALAIERWRLGSTARRTLDNRPLVLITDTAHGPQIEAVNRAGAAAGARKGMMLADARTLFPEIATAPADPAADQAFLEKLAIWAQRWGPCSIMDEPDGLLVDVTAVAHLFDGERQLLADVNATFLGQELSTRCAIGPTAGAAWALSHYGSPDAILGGEEDSGTKLDELPVAALRLDSDVLTVLRRLGLKKVGEVTTIGRDAIQRRFRSRKSPSANPLIRLDQLFGRVPEPRLPVVQQETPLAQRRLLEPIRHRQLLDKVVADLAEDLAGQLENKGVGARRLELGLWRIDGEVVVRHLEMVAPTRQAEHVSRLFASKLDGVDAGFGIEIVRLRASWTEQIGLEQGDIEAATTPNGTSLAVCMDRLTVRLGAKAIRRPVPFSSHLPERAQRWQLPLEPELDSQGELAFHKRPLKLLDKPERIAVLYATPDGYPQRFRWRNLVHEVIRVEGPERIAPEWWRERGTTRLRDYYRIEDGEGRRYWIYRLGILGDGRGNAPDWYLQGLWA